MVNSVLFTTNENGLAEITLNQPQSINSLTYEMIEQLQEKLLQWERDPVVKLVLLTGAGEKGFCAGGDMKALYAASQSGEALKVGKKFFSLEYQVDQLVADYSKPIVAYLDGVVMGGGVGLTYGASHRIVTERTKWAMPEMNIGFFPDVGAAYFLNRAPGEIGRYLALTSTVINGAEAIYIQAADYFIESTDFDNFIAEMRKISWQEDSFEQILKQHIKKYTKDPVDKNLLQHHQSKIDEHFRFETMEEISASLQNGGSEFTQQVENILLSKSPLSLKVTLKQLIKGREKTFAECLATDLVIAYHFMENPDFYEGVRSVLIDKDHDPDYKYKRLSDVSNELVSTFFG